MMRLWVPSLSTRTSNYVFDPNARHYFMGSGIIENLKLVLLLDHLRHLLAYL